MKPIPLTLTVPELDPHDAEILAQFFSELADALWQQTVPDIPYHEPPEIDHDFDDPIPF